MSQEINLSACIVELKAKLADSDPFRRGFHALKSGKSVAFDTLVGDAALLLASELAEASEKLLLMVAATNAEADRAVDELPIFSNIPVLSFPFLPESLTSEDESAAHEIFLAEDRIFGERLRVLKLLRQRKDRSPLILVTTPAALAQPTPSLSQIDSATRRLAVGEENDRQELIGWLNDGGFHAATAVELPGEYSVRGGILDLFALDWERPVRIEYFGDEIESIRPFDIQTQRSCGEEKEIFLTRLRPNRGSETTFLDHLPDETLPFLLETDDIIRRGGDFDRFFAEKTVKNEKTGQNKRLSFAEALNRLYARPTAHAVSLAARNDLADETVSFDFQSVERFSGNLNRVRDELDQLLPGVEVTIFCQTEAERRRLNDAFGATATAKSGRLFYEIGPLSRGFAYPAADRILLGCAELFRRTTLHRKKTRTLSKTIDSFIDLAPGDLVIHVSHGLARFRGLKTITKGRQTEEHLELEFADTVALYVPVSKISLVQKYIGSGNKNPRLAKLNGKQWAKQKNEVRNAIFDLATEMLDLQAKRKALVGTAFPTDSDWQRDFEESFPFDETFDQLSAIEAIKDDMERTRPMDRLLCGDVGFGKTEVAIRAAFKAVDAGYQVAVLVPTTILAEQHYRVFSERMAPFPISVGVLSRFTDKKTEAETLEKMRTGEIDIVIGTHRIVQKDVAFRNLGLVVIDEEQRFGVKDKDHLKRLRSMVDVLTMTATPIPRTLHFSLLGLRDISNLQTPPQDRLPIETKVVRFDTQTIRRATLRELSRGGQVYFLHNRVRDIEQMGAKLRSILPEARIAIAHAQMPDDQLEEIMRDFLLHRYDVLLCTTIIENGLDIPNTNTIFINHANRFGLAELHQLRGRVGRFRNQAYCYLLLEPNAPLTADSTKRLRAIEEYSHLGAGFHLALRDLEIRGAGNILGTQQSGHIAMIGYEMYCEFLEAAVRALKNEPQRERIEIETDLPGETMIPKSFVADQRAKIDLYRRIVRVTTDEELEQIEAEIRDRFGALPIQTERLLLHAKIRIAAWRYRIKSIQISEESGGPYVAMRFVAPDLILKLKKLNEPRRIPVRITDGQKAYIPVPKSFLNKEGRPDPDHLLYYILKALTV